MQSPPLDSTHGRLTSGVACYLSFGKHTRSKYVERGMTSPPLDSAHDRTTSGATCHHRLWKAHTFERRRAWHAIITFGQHKQSDQQTRLNDVERDIPTPPLESTHGRSTSSVAFHYRLWAAHMVERPLAWHAIISFRQHKWSNDVGRGMTSPPLDSTHGRTTSGVV